MEQVSALPQSTRRWPRYRVDLPVCIVGLNGVLTTPLPARGTDISRAGMALRATVPLRPGDLMQIQFPTSARSRVTAVVRNRIGNRLGLEFLTQLPPDDEAPTPPKISAKSALPALPQPQPVPAYACNPRILFTGLRRKQEELRQLKKEIEALHVAIVLLADEEREREPDPVGWDDILDLSN
jgi:hypothetical protein